MILRIPALVALLASAGRPLPSSAFQPPHASRGHARHSVGIGGNPASHPNVILTSPRPSNVDLHMSSIPDDDDDENLLSQLPLLFVDLKRHLERRITDSLPPAPEDGIAISGDVLALFVYTYLDHFVNQIYLEASAKMEVADLVTGNHANNPNHPDVSLPVWFDPSHLHTFGHNWLAVSSSQISPPYAPAISASGLAFVSLAASWLFCGYLSGAFLHKNTLECEPDRAMLVVLRTWACAATAVAVLAWGSDAAWGALDAHFNALSAPARGGLTRADADFIVDSLTVLAFWRLTLNWLLGYRR